CPCVEANRPHAPINPSPLDGATNVDVATGISWAPSPLDTNIASYDVYFGTNPLPSHIATVTTPSYQPPVQLAEQTKYYWHVVVNNTEGLDGPGPTWSLTTRPPNLAPSVPSLVYPANATASVAYNIDLQWSASDPENDPLTYDLYFGT